MQNANLPFSLKGSPETPLPLPDFNAKPKSLKAAKKGKKPRWDDRSGKSATPQQVLIVNDLARNICRYKPATSPLR